VAAILASWSPALSSRVPHRSLTAGGAAERLASGADAELGSGVSDGKTGSWPQAAIHSLPLVTPHPLKLQTPRARFTAALQHKFARKLAAPGRCARRRGAGREEQRVALCENELEGSGSTVAKPSTAAASCTAIRTAPRFASRRPWKPCAPPVPCSASWLLPASAWRMPGPRLAWQHGQDDGRGSLVLTRCSSSPFPTHPADDPSPPR
jgi:hypothetical protein